MASPETTRTTWAIPLTGLIACAFACSAAQAQLSKQRIAEAAACGIQQALLESPGHYVIAIVEHPGRILCEGAACTESLKIIKLLASRTPSGRRYGDSAIDMEASQETQTMPRGFRSFVVAIPVKNAAAYYLPITHGPVDQQDERTEEAAVKLAFGPPVGPLCKKTLPKTFRMLKATE